MQWEDLVQCYRADQQARCLSAGTVKVNFDRLSLLVSYLISCQITPERITTQHFRNYIASKCGNNSPETIGGKIRTFKAFWTALIKMDLWNAGNNPTVGLSKPKVGVSLRKTISPAQFEVILNSCDRREFLGHRNYVLLLLLWDAMIRRAEIAGLRLGDLYLTDKRIKVTGKNSKTRLVPISDKTVKALRIFLTKHCGDKAPSDHLFTAQNGSLLSLIHIRQICQRQAAKVKIKIGCHILRHSSATEYLRLGGQLPLLSQILGHADISTTMIYTHLIIDDAVKSYQQFSPLSNVRV